MLISRFYQHFSLIKYIFFCFKVVSCDTNTRDRGGNAQPVIFINPEEDLLLMRKLLTRFVKNDEGAALVEYGLLVGLIAVVAVGAVTTLGATIAGYFTTINAAL
jgi:pilus assembly protein Flp/PilA